MKELKLKGYHGNEIILNGATREQLVAFVEEEINHWIWVYEDGIQRWSYEITYSSIFDPQRGCRVVDRGETVMENTDSLIEYIAEDFGLLIK